MATASTPGRTSVSFEPTGSDVICADNLDILRCMPDECVDLVYVDPPFGTGQVRRQDRIRLGVGSASRTGFGGRTYSYDVVSSMSYRDDMSLGEYLAFLEVRLTEIRRVLRQRGSIYLHLDYRSVHYARILMDDIFGPEHLLNEIIWAYDYGGRPRDRWPKKHDNILWYAKSPEWVFNREEIDRLPYMAPTLVGADKAAAGKLPTDVWWMTVVPTASHERTGYPTQKPVRLLTRILVASSRPDDLVADFFAGSGTTGEAAIKLGRRYLLVDNNEAAVAMAKGRLARVVGQRSLFSVGAHD